MSYTTAALPKIPLSYGVQIDYQGGASMQGQVNPLEIQMVGLNVERVVYLATSAHTSAPNPLPLPPSSSSLQTNILLYHCTF